MKHDKDFKENNDLKTYRTKSLPCDGDLKMTHPSGEAVKTEETVIMNIEEDQKDTDDKSHSTGDKEVIESTVEKEDFYENVNEIEESSVIPTLVQQTDNTGTMIMGEGILEQYEQNHLNADYIKKVNVWLMHISTTKSQKEIQRIFSKMYLLEAKVHKNNKAVIFCCLHENIQAKLVDTIVDAHSPGFSFKLQKSFEQCIR